MNYGKNGVKKRQRELHAMGGKFMRKLMFLCLKLILAAIIFVCVCGAAGGIGLFVSILTGTPTIRISDVVATGQATIVYDAAGNEIDQYVGSDSNRIEVTWDGVPRILGQAFVAIEDERFYQHNGIDYKGIVRAGYEFVRSGGKRAEGASTITQQLLKNTVFTEWTEEGENRIKKIKRKIQEQYLALEVTKNTEKDEILLRYMNAINLGQNTLGVESASQRYFGKSAIDLNISECAVIASITQNPSYYNPLRYPEHNAVRREKCLNHMLEQKFITQAEYDAAIADTDAVYERIGYHDTELTEGNTTQASYFSDALYDAVYKDLVAAGYDPLVATHMLNSGGLRINSTMDPKIQKIMDEEFTNPENFGKVDHFELNYALTITDNAGEQHNFSKENMVTWYKNNGRPEYNLVYSTEEKAKEDVAKFRAAMYDRLGVEESEDNFDERFTMTIEPQVSMVVVDHSTGYVVAMEGGRGGKEGRRTLNRATDSLRSAGSTFKVVASFAPGMDAAGITLATVYNDAPFNYNDGTPIKNWWDTGYKGISSIRKGVEQSMNIIAVKNLTVISPQLGYDYLKGFGFTSLTDGTAIGGKIYSDVNQTLALGGLTYGVSSYEMTAAYGAIANGGVYHKPTLYTTVTDADGNVILDHTKTQSNRVLRETTSWLLIDAMKDVITKGTAKDIKIDNMAVAGKTGTSTDYWDVWFAGMTPYYTAAAWTGYDTPATLDANNNEKTISRRIWRAVMARVHADLPYADFEKPEGIIEVQVCSQSGLLPREDGLCAGTTYTEYFEEGTEPVDYCNIHYSGYICGYDGKIASQGCPFAYIGSTTLPLLEQEELIQGSTTIIENEDGTQTYILPSTSNYCSHDAAFFENPNSQDIINGQQWEIANRGAAGTPAPGPEEQQFE